MFRIRERLQSMRNPLRGSMGRRLAIMIVPVVLVPLILQGGASYIRSRDILLSQATSQLESALQAETQTVLDWVGLREERLLLGSQRQALRAPMLSLLNTRMGSQTFLYSQDAVRLILYDLQVQDANELYSDLLIIRTSDGSVIASTQTEWEGEILTTVRDGSLPIEELSTITLYNVPLLSPDAVSVFTTMPLVVPMANDEAVIIGINSDINLGALLEEMQVYREQVGVYRIERGETFFLLPPDVVVRLPRYSMEPEAQQETDNPLFDEYAVSSTGTAEYNNPGGESMLAAYNEISELGMTLAVELPQTDVFAQVETLGTFSIIVVLAAAVIVAILITVVTNRLLSPLADLTEFAERISRGDWQYRVPEDRDDELGILASAFNRMANDLRGIYQSLEERVQERTQQIQIASQVARAVTATPVLEELLFKAVNLIRDQFGYYYVSIFLLDEPHEFANLTEATGDVGKALIARGHRLKVGGQSIIGWVTQNNQPRVASEVSQDPIHFQNEFLPDTQAELAVPLQVGGIVLGALDVQSDQADVFRPQDIEVLQTLADQLSAAIQNARLAQNSAVAAERARVISQATRELSGMMDVEQVLDKAVSVLHEALGKPEIQVELVQPQQYEEQSTRPVDPTASQT